MLFQDGKGNECIMRLLKTPIELCVTRKYNGHTPKSEN